MEARRKADASERNTAVLGDHPIGNASAADAELDRHASLSKIYRFSVGNPRVRPPHLSVKPAKVRLAGEWTSAAYRLTVLQVNSCGSWPPGSHESPGSDGLPFTGWMPRHAEGSCSHASRAQKKVFRKSTFPALPALAPRPVGLAAYWAWFALLRLVDGDDTRTSYVLGRW